MKNIFKAIFSIFLALTVSSPIEALANPALESAGALEEEEVRTIEAGAEGYTMMFLRSDFGLGTDMANTTDQAGSVVMFVTNADKKIVKNAQVVVTLVSKAGEQTMFRARPYKGGYFIQTNGLEPGRYRLEAEVISDGWLLTDQFYFEHV